MAAILPEEEPVPHGAPLGPDAVPRKEGKGTGALSIGCVTSITRGRRDKVPPECDQDNTSLLPTVPSLPRARGQALLMVRVLFRVLPKRAEGVT